MVKEKQKHEHEHDWVFKILERRIKKEKEVKLVWICFDCLEVEYNPTPKEELEKLEIAP